MTRTKKPAAKKPAEGMIDTTEEVITDEPTAPEAKKPPRQRPAGPKKVINETGKAISDAGAIALVTLSKGKDNRGLTFPEAQSITAPTCRIIARRLPAFLKKFAPKTSLNPDDAADLEEIAITFGKYALRLLMLTLQEIIAKKESQAERVTRNDVPMQNIPAHLTEDIEALKEEKERVGVSSNGHNPMFDPIGVDFGQGDL